MQTNGDTKTTYHAPAERARGEELKTLARRATDDPIVAVMFDAVGGSAMVLDEHRQILAANAELLALLDLKTGESVVGLRPGEAVHCVHAHRGPGGCGTSVQCRHCGAVVAILAAQVSEHPVDGQCTITHVVDGTPRLSDFRVRVHPLDLQATRVYVAVFQDVTATKWRELQHRMFLHDVANMLTGLTAWSSMLASESPSEAAVEIVRVVQRLSDILQSHRLLMRCESGELKLSPRRVSAESLETDLRSWFDPIARDHGCQLVIEWRADEIDLTTDTTLLLRVLGNLMMNAIEASETGDSVQLIGKTEGEQTVFFVHNPGVISEIAAAQLFRTRCSSKGPGRGFGMYAVQVFGEQYLGGRIAFESSLEGGTTFRFSVPNLELGA